MKSGTSGRETTKDGWSQWFGALCKRRPSPWPLRDGLEALGEWWTSVGGPHPSSGLARVRFPTAVSLPEKSKSKSTEELDIQVHDSDSFISHPSTTPAHAGPLVLDGASFGTPRAEEQRHKKAAAARSKLC